MNPLLMQIIMSMPVPTKLVPVSWIDDLETFLDFHMLVFASSPWDTYIGQLPDSGSTIQALRDFRRVRLTRSLSSSDGTTHHGFKLLDDSKPSLSDAEKSWVALAHWQAPASPASGLPPPLPEAAQSTPAMAERQEVIDQLDAVYVRLAALTKRCMPGRNVDGSAPFWRLKLLAVHPEYQRRGLGRWMLEHGLELARKQAQEQPGRVEGAVCIGRPSGMQTYERAGMKEVDAEQIDYGNDFGERYVWMKLGFERRGSGEGKWRGEEEI